MSARVGVLLRTLLWLLLGGWVGALVLFAAVVAPAAFRVLPSGEQAGRLVGEVLPALQLYGAGAGLALAVLARLLGRGPLAGLLPLLLGGLGLVSLFGVTPRLEEIRELAFGAEPDAAARTLFGRLHAVSGLLYAVTLAGALVLAVVHAAGDVPGAAKKTGDFS